MIRLENITKSFLVDGKNFCAVNDVNLEIKKGEIFGIIGFSGAGKSTLVRCINLLERPDSGKVFVNDRELTALSAKDLRLARRKISMSSSLILRFDLLVVTVPFSPKSIIFLPEKNYALRNFVSPRPNLLSE